MRIQKTYIWYCVATWSLWVITLILSVIAGNAYDVRNVALYHFASKLSGASFLISLIPVHPVLFSLSLYFSIKNKREGYTSFNCFGFILTTLLAILILGNHVLVSGI